MDLTSTLDRIEEMARRVSAGDLSHAEAVLSAQTVALNALFACLACKAHVSDYIDHLDRYLRLARKAQSQCRTTIETLALLQNPPVFARRANVAAQQVVNDGTMLAGSRAGNLSTAQNGLLEAHRERLDGGEAGQASGRDPGVAAVGVLDRPANGRG